MTIIDLPPTGRGGMHGADRSQLGRAEAEALGLRIQDHAAWGAQAECEFLLLLEEFDRREGLVWFHGLKSLAHWLAWSCSMSAGTAREHVRVARALGRMPRTVEMFRTGRLSYSKVREMSRVIDTVDEDTLVHLALVMTASQLARTVQAFRRIDGTAIAQEARREARWSVREDGMVEIRAVLPADVGAEVVTALERAVDLDRTPIPDRKEGYDNVPAGTPEAAPPTMRDVTAAPVDTSPAPSVPIDHRRADALVELARAYLDSAPADRSGEDRHLVLVQVDAQTLAEALGPQKADAGTTPTAQATPASAPSTPAHGAKPARLMERPRHGATCSVVDGPALDAATVHRLMCTGRTALTVRDGRGDILHLGRSRRLASPAQRRALRLRDHTCRFPGCHQTRHLDAHHLVPWQDGGDTDLENLALLCRRHHVLIHENGLHLVREDTATAHGAPVMHVVDDEGRPVEAFWPHRREHVHLVSQTAPSRTRTPGTSDAPTGPAEVTTGRASGPTGTADSVEQTRPDRIFPLHAGYGFDLASCVAALCEGEVSAAA